MAKKKTELKSREYYMALPYKIITYPTGESGDTAFFAEVLELEGCCVDGATYTEAYEKLMEEMGNVIQMCLNRGIEPPVPRPLHKYSGRVLVRMPASLHYKLTLKAYDNNVSVNQLIVSKLSSSINM